MSLQATNMRSTGQPLPSVKLRLRSDLEILVSLVKNSSIYILDYAFFHKDVTRRYPPRTETSHDFHTFANFVYNGMLSCAAFRSGPESTTSK